MLDDPRFQPLVFGSLLSLSSGQVLAYFPDGVMDLDLVTTSSDGDFLVLFSDLSDGGVVIAAAGKVRRVHSER